MLRFIQLGDQIKVLSEGNEDFAWYDTVTDSFLKFSGSVVWDSWEDFVEDLLDDPSTWKADLRRFGDLAGRSRT